MEELTKDLFIVKPSVVLLDETTKREDFKKNKLYRTHIVKFESRPEDITIAVRKVNTVREIFGDKNYYTSVGMHCSEDDYYIDVRNGDKILLANYLWEKNTNHKFISAFEKYVISLKNYYSHEDIRIILGQIKAEITQSKPVRFTYKRKYEFPLKVNNIYSDPD